MPNEEPKTILIESLPKAKPKRPTLKAPSLMVFFAFSFLIVFFYVGLFILVALLEISMALKVLGLLLGSFILEDVLHFIKRIWKEKKEEL